MIVSLIAAVAEDNYAIGAENRLLWNIPEDLKRFRKLTLGHPIVMGRKTFESIGRVLPERTNIILSRKELVVKGAYVFSNLTEALEFCRDRKEREVFIIGGAEIYRQTLPLADRLYITWVKGSYKDADAFFPDIEWREWRLVSEEKKNGYTFCIYERKAK